jgi:hypothetical protein
MKQTAVQWLKQQYIERGETLPLGVFQEALEMEKDQMIRFTIICHQNILRSKNAPKNLISENLILFEDYLLFEDYYTQAYNL